MQFTLVGLHLFALFKWDFYSNDKWRNTGEKSGGTNTKSQFLQKKLRNYGICVYVCRSYSEDIS